MRGYHCSIKSTHKVERKVAGRESGIIYFFHTNEKGKHNKKHIHARYQDTNTSIGLDNVETLVSAELKPRKKHKEALKYVETHKSKLLAEWDALVSTNTNSVRRRHSFTNSKNNPQNKIILTRLMRQKQTVK